MNSSEKSHNKMSGNMYPKFFIMLGLSFLAMYVSMYLNTYAIDHVYFSLTRFYMSCMGISAMAVIMLSFMLNMYRNKKKNIAIYVGSFVLFISTLFLVRTQTPVGDVLWLRAMIPHHSIAILTSERADIEDPEVKKLAEAIIKTQKEEIAQMKQLIEKLKAQE